jgi:hypothetical protein
MRKDKNRNQPTNDKNHDSAKNTDKSRKGGYKAAPVQISVFFLSQNSAGIISSSFFNFF